MRYFTLLLFLISVMTGLNAQTSVFKWYDPLSLNPPFTPPTSADRYGPYIEGKTITSAEGVTVDIDDSNVRELSQKARFLYGYLTNEVELRVYPASWITIIAPEGKCIRTISFTGAKADDSYLSYNDSEGTFKGNTWTADTRSTRTVEFSILATINCTSTTVVIGDYEAEVVDIESENTTGTIIWYTLDGIRLSAVPSSPGLYIRRDGVNSRLAAIR